MSGIRTLSTAVVIGTDCITSKDKVKTEMLTLSEQFQKS